MYIFFITKNKSVLESTLYKLQKIFDFLIMGHKQK